MSTRPLIALILAAGRGTRMKSTLPKVLHQVAGVPMLTHVISAAQTLNPKQIIVVIGPDMDDVAAAAHPHETVIQTEQLGTGHAVKIALAGRDLKKTDILVLYGDVPLTPVNDLAALTAKHQSTSAAVTILAMRPEIPTGYGRLITDARDQVSTIVEELDATPDQRQINLCNSGMMLLRGEGLNDLLAALQNNNAKGEYYLTDLLSLARGKGGIGAYVEGDANDLNGVNDRVQLAAAEARFQKKTRETHMRAGVTLIDPASVFFAADTVIGQDVVIEPNVFFGPGVRIANNVRILANCHLYNVTIAQGAQIGPFARIRHDTQIGQDVHIGNFVEIKNSHLGNDTKASHLTYLCDLDVGAQVNIGAGATFSNYDGAEKTRTKIDNRSFIGANSTVVSPVDIGTNTYIAAGSVITDDVPADKLAFGRARQTVRDHTKKTIAYSVKKKEK